MPHHALRDRVSVSQREHHPPLEPEIDLHHHVTPVAGYTPGARRASLAARGRARRRDDLGRRLTRGRELRTRRTVAGPLVQVRRAHLPAAMRARGAMIGADALATHRALRHLVGPEDRCHTFERAAGFVTPANRALGFIRAP